MTFEHDLVLVVVDDLDLEGGGVHGAAEHGQTGVDLALALRGKGEFGSYFSSL